MTVAPLRRVRERSLAAVLMAAAAISLASPSWAVAMAGSGLSPRLEELAAAPLRDAPPAQQSVALGLAPDGPGSLLRRGRRVVVEVRFDHGAAAGAKALDRKGAAILDVSRRYQVDTVAAPPARLRAIAGTRGVGSVTPVIAPMHADVECHGLDTSEGDVQLEAASARRAFGVDGSGVRVGILSDSFDEDPAAATHAGGDVASGDLPGPGNPCGRTAPVGVLEDLASTEATDEGRAMAQIVHDLAPGAALSFATAFAGPISFAENIRALHAAGAAAIVDDVAYFEEPFFQEGPIATAASQVSAEGSAYFSAAGNDNLIEAGTGNDIASWEAPEFRPSGSCPAALEVATAGKADECMDFDPAAGEPDETFGIKVKAGAELLVDLQWAEPWQGVKADLNAFLLNAEGKPLKAGGNLVASAEENVAGSEEPFELLSWTNKEGTSQQVQLAIDDCSGACNPAANPSATPRLKLALLENGSGVTATEYPESAGGDVVGPTVFGHAAASATIAVGAIESGQELEPEPYSSRGPASEYFGPADGQVAAAPIAPRTVAKPDLTASDCVRTTFFVPEAPGLFRFCGTSAAAPHAAAVAALMKQANPSISPGQIRAALATTARAVGAFGPDAVGAGLIDAFGAVGSVALPPSIAITERPPSLGRNRRPAIGFAANRPVTFSCSLDGAPPAPCSSPFVPAEPLGNGFHGFVVEGVDAAGRSGRSETVGFTVDARRPRTFFRHHPPRTIRTPGRRARAVFRFGSNEAGVTFACRVDGGFQRFCKQRFARSFRIGKHVLSVRARDAAGNVDATPAVFHFKVKRAG